jgi:hypothetical protein
VSFGSLQSLEIVVDDCDDYDYDIAFDDDDDDDDDTAFDRLSLSLSFR